MLSFMELSTLLKLLCVFSVFYVVGLYVYRMYLDPLSKIPGPKIAAASLWYEFYYDVVLQGRYTWKIWEMHNKYGKPMVTALTTKWKDRTLNPNQAPSSESVLMRYTSMIPR